jgi:hypothetical protein
MLISLLGVHEKKKFNYQFQALPHSSGRRHTTILWTDVSSRSSGRVKTQGYLDIPGFCNAAGGDASAHET